MFQGKLLKIYCNKDSEIVFEEYASKSNTQDYSGEFSINKTQVQVMFLLLVYNIMCIFSYCEIFGFDVKKERNFEDLFQYMIMNVLFFVIVSFFFSLEPIEKPVKKALLSGLAYGMIFTMLRYILKLGFYQKYRTYLLANSFLLDLAFILYLFNFSFNLAPFYLVVIAIILEGVFFIVESAKYKWLE